MLMVLLQSLSVDNSISKFKAASSTRSNTGSTIFFFGGLPPGRRYSYFFPQY